MTERANTLVRILMFPLGDIGAGGREKSGYLYGQYKRLRNEYTGVLTGVQATYLRWFSCS